MDHTKSWCVDNLDCASCAANVEQALQKQQGVQKASINLVTKRLTVHTDAPKDTHFWDLLEQTAKQAEPELTLSPESGTLEQIWSFKGVDCPVCANTIEQKLAENSRVSSVRVDFATKKIHIRTQKQESPEFYADLIQTAKAVEPSLQVAQQNLDKQVPLVLQPRFIRILVSLAAFASAMVFDFPWLSLAIYLIAGYDVLLKAGRNILHGKLFDEYFLMTVATLGAVALGDLAEASAVMLFYLIGEFFQNAAVNKSRRSILETLDMKVDQARMVKENKTELVASQSVAVGSIIRVLAGEKIPLDGKVVKGSANLDMQSLTGESAPRLVQEGEAVLSASVNLSGPLDIEVSKPYEQSTAAKILKLVEESASQKAPTERFITTFARYYTPVVVGLGLALAIIPSLILGDWGTWIYRALVFLVISCPCALVISVPLSYFAGIGKSASRGILIKGGNYLEALQKADTFVFDKTGTLTTGTFTLAKVLRLPSSTLDESYLTQLAASLERQSNHPLAKAFNGIETPFAVSLVEERAGKGLVGDVDGKAVAAGNATLFNELGIPILQKPGNEATILLAVNGIHQASFILEDNERPEADNALKRMRDMGIKHMVMISGDTEANAARISRNLGLDSYQASLLPHEKQAALIGLSKQHPNLAYIGDGMNDAPSLAASKVGISMGSKASDAAMESADIVVMRDDLNEVANLLHISKRTAKIVRQNITFALTIKVLALALGALGLASMWIAVLADTGVTILAVLNSLRLLLFRPAR
ncbi:heavy metal translocating P-type ATPase [Sphaerochaeta sp.]|uniref:heavy metal translocating P-type ATPase n=1 Tax=Sphaerochaeta sp. TaxID=1972642 RepID=UPI002FC9DA2A